MTLHTYQFLKQLKRKLITLSQYNQVKQSARKQSLKIIQLWKFKPQIKVLFKMAKFQSYMMFLFGFTVLPYILYTKYQQDKQKVTRIAIFMPFAVGACVGPLILYKRFSKKLIQSIIFNFQSKKLGFVRFADGNLIQVGANQDITFIPSDKGRVKELIWAIKDDSKNKKEQIKKFQIQGLGDWESMEFFEFLIKNNDDKVL